MDGRWADLRATLHLNGANSVETLLTQITALSKQIHPTALEVLKFIEVYLKNRKSSMHLCLVSDI